ncbi:DNA primase [Candidatus Hydrogenisulfobacillus filiaventi]|uniref:DNA primase n=1 Tax=Candidatus Hydrogenisulfobacillus filiaventi TaxID=2707344 RepID=A0A6F8ZI40_9FIRM|nr:DNA primase [Candidatus Hydrogenisulfobacillus filiaventi]
MPDQVYNEWINRVREATDIVAVVGQTVQLKRKGRKWWGLCPFHVEKTPSFSVDPDKQLFYCFGCHTGGTVFTFLERVEGKDFLTVVRELAERAAIPEPGRSPVRERAARERGRLEDILEWSWRFFTARLAEAGGADARAALAARGVEGGLAERFGLGYAPPGWDGLVRFLSSRGVEAEEMVTAGVAVRGQRGVYDRWRDRLMFPIRDSSGRVVGFGGRALREGQEPKYLNSPETPVFRKGQILFGLDLARAAWRQGRRPLLVEGYFDVVACHAAGLEQAVASLGTALTAEQARILARHATEVDLLYDADAAGQDAMRRAFPILAGAGLKVNRVTLPAGKDADECRREAGDAALAAAVEARESFLEGEVRRLAARVRAGLAERTQALAEVRTLWQVEQDPVRRDLALQRAAEAFRIEIPMLAHTFGRAQGGGRHTSGKFRHTMERVPRAAGGVPPQLVQLLALLMRFPDQIGVVQAALPGWSAGSPLARAVEALAADAGAGGLETAEEEVRNLLVAATTVTLPPLPAGMTLPDLARQYLQAALLEYVRARHQETVRRLAAGAGAGWEQEGKQWLDRKLELEAGIGRRRGEG